MKNDKDDVAIALLAVPTILVLTLLIAVPFALFNAWVVLTLYNWFALPLGAPELNIWHAWGLMLLASRFTSGNLNTKTEEDTKKAWGKIAMYIVASLLALLIGFVIKGLI